MREVILKIKNRTEQNKTIHKRTDQNRNNYQKTPPIPGFFRISQYDMEKYF